MKNGSTELLLFIFAMCAGLPAMAVDGVVEINEASAFVGGITAGDQPEYPVTISEPGSYRLTGNLQSINDRDFDPVIEITADNVDLDLNGFAVFGPRRIIIFGARGDGIHSSGGTNVKVRNGTVAYFGGNGVAVDGTIENVTTRENAGDGFSCQTCRIVRSAAHRNQGSGIVAGPSSKVEDSAAIDNSLNGITVGAGSVVTGCISSENHRDGIVLLTGGLARNNTVENNGGDGIDASGSNIVGNTIGPNTGLDLMLDASSAYRANVIAGAGVTHISGGVQTGINLCNGSPCL